jgi:hypothetical protein
VVNLEPQAAANAMIAGTSGVDAAMTYEPFLSAVRAKPEAGKIIATTLDYPMIMDTFGCTPKFLAEQPKAAKALADAYFDSLVMIRAEPQKSFGIMGADVKQSAEAFEKSQSYLRWQDRAANLKFFAGEHLAFSKKAAEILLEAGIIEAEKLVVLSDIPGVLRDVNDPESLIPHITAAEARTMIADGTIAGGMIPKIEGCLDTLAQGVKKIHIIDGRLRHSLLLEIYTTSGVGTELVRDDSLAPRKMAGKR